MSQYQYIAVDTGKELLQVQSQAHAFGVSNDAGGWRKIREHAARLPDALVVCDASGGYERPLLNSLSQSGVPIRLVNSSRVRAFAASEGIKAKSDRLDAKVIFAFAREKKLQPMVPPSAEQQKLRELLDRRTQLVELIAREKNHLEHAGKEASASCQRLIRVIEKEVEKIQLLIRRLIATQPRLRAEAEILLSVDGVGEVSAWSILAYLHEITSLSRNKLVALAGLAPFDRDSGSICAKRHISGGRFKLRRVLYMAAHSAATHNPVIRPYVQGLLQRGKPYKCAIVAAMRKLLLHLQSLLRNASKKSLAS
jgi:transposase